MYWHNTWFLTSRDQDLQSQKESDMGKKDSDEGNKVEAMASSAVLKAAKKELRSFIKQKLSNISSESVATQSKRNFWSIL